MSSPDSSSANSDGYVIVESVATKKGKQLLRPMLLDFPPGEVVAIMGPSGGGKSTLLDFVTCSVQSNVVAEGQVHLPGSLAYVPQDDRLHGFYTVRKYMEHYARLAGMRRDGENDGNIKSIIDALGLTEQADTIVGDIFRRGLSGGQKRRLSIGLEALSAPNNLFLDEPTSGLDSESALAVMKFLKGYAAGAPGRRVILTIHQPSSFMWELIDRVVLLSKGRLVYQGPRSSMEAFFEYSNAPTPPRYNPCDHYLAAVNTEFSMCVKSPDEWHAGFVEWREKNDDAAHAARGRELARAYAAASRRALDVGDSAGGDEEKAVVGESVKSDAGFDDFMKFLHQDKDPGSDGDGIRQSRRASMERRRSAIIYEQMTAEELRSFRGLRANGFRAMIELIGRYVLNLIYNPGILGTRVAMYVMLALIIGALFWDLGDLTTYTSINSRIALLFYCVAFFVFMSVAVLPFTVMERGIITKEERNNYYHPVFYQAAQALAAIPGTAVLAGLTTLIITQMTGLREPGWYFLNMFLALNCAEALAQLISHIVPHFIIGMALVAGFYGMFMLLQGFMLVPSEFPNWLAWSYYIGFHTYSWRTFVFKEFDGQVYPDAGWTGKEVLETYEIEDVNPVHDMIVLVGYAAVIHLFSFLVLWGKRAWHLRLNDNKAVVAGKVTPVQSNVSQ